MSRKTQTPSTQATPNSKLGIKPPRKKNPQKGECGLSAINHLTETEESSTKHKAHHFLGEEEAFIVCDSIGLRKTGGKFWVHEITITSLTMTKLSPASSPHPKRKGSICEILPKLGL